MKFLALTAILVATTITNSFAASIIYTDTFWGESLRGTEIDHIGYIDSDDAACYRGNPWKARRLLIDLAYEDEETLYSRVWFDKKTKTLELSYVHTKCLDDSMDATFDSCRAYFIISKCK